MFTKSKAGSILLSFFLATDQVFGRDRWHERDNKPVFLHPRRFGQENPAVLQKLRNACPGQVCGNLAGRAVTPLLAAQPECSQQDMADAIIDASRQFDAATQANMVAIAIEYRQAEKNTPPDFTTNPPTLRNSVFCQKAPKNVELNGLVQAQDPANDPDVFFDPALERSVSKGEQPNTFPFKAGIFDNNGDKDSSAPTPVFPTPSQVDVTTASAVRAKVSDPACPTAFTVTLSGTNPAAASATNAITVTVGIASPIATASPLPGDVNFGTCTVPEIEFGVGFDNRRETSFRPVDRTSYSHGSAQNVNIITQFVCDSLTNTCGANQAAKDLCATASTAVSSARSGTGAQADAFNAAFGIRTRFVDLASVDNQGNAIPGTGTTDAGGSGDASSTAEASSASSPVATSTTSTGGVGIFGSCSTPQIAFGAGFDGRKETSFRPANQTSYNHGSAQDIDIITQSICDDLTNSCGADQTAKDTCAQAAAAARSASANSGAQADAFNAVFGIRTDFADVQPIDDQGKPEGKNNESPQAKKRPNTSTVRATFTTASAAEASRIAQVTNNNTGSSTPNLQTFTGVLGGIAAPAVRDLGSGRFLVEGNSEFNDRQNALVRSCDVQNNECSDAANASRNQNGFTVSACGQQLSQCRATAGA